MRRLAIVAAFTAIVVGCAGSAPATDGQTIEIVMRDFAFSPETVTLRAGEKVTLRFKNIGTLEHEFMAGAEPEYGKGYLKDWFAGAQLEKSGGHDMGHAGQGVRVAPNSTVSVTFVVPAPGGAFEFGCFVPGHYEFGMRGSLLVDSALPVADPAGGAKRTGPAATMMPSTAPAGDGDGHGH